MTHAGFLRRAWSVVVVVVVVVPALVLVCVCVRLEGMESWRHHVLGSPGGITSVIHPVLSLRNRHYPARPTNFLILPIDFSS